MMKKTTAILAITFCALMLLSSFATVAAGQKVSAVLNIRTSIGGVSQVHDTAPEKEWTTDGGITHKQGITRTVDYDTVKQLVKLTITYPDPIGVKTYIGSILAYVDVMINTKTGVTTNHYHKWTISFPVQAGMTEAGAFTGVHTWSIDATPTLTGEGHAVLQGSGWFEGQTLMLKMELPPLPPVWKGELLIK